MNPKLRQTLLHSPVCGNGYALDSSNLVPQILTDTPVPLQRGVGDPKDHRNHPGVPRSLSHSQNPNRSKKRLVMCTEIL